MARSVPNRRYGESECVRLTRKLAERIDGVDLSESHVGDTLYLSPHDAELLVAEGWGERLETTTPRKRGMRRPR
jgi:hypothetical protein